MKKEDFKVGQTVYLLAIEYERFEFHRIERRIKEVTVRTIGKKYITVSFGSGMRFDMTNDFREDTAYSPTYRLYLSVEDIQKAFKRKETIQEIREKVRFGGGIFERMTDDDLQDILKIIRKYKW